MAIETLSFLNFNISLQVGDTLYYTSTSENGGFLVGDNIIEIGPVTNISKSGSITTISYELYVNATAPTTDDFILFSKDNQANMSSILGYYAEVKFQNTQTSTNKVPELYSVACEISESSK